MIKKNYMFFLLVILLLVTSCKNQAVETIKYPLPDEKKEAVTTPNIPIEPEIHEVTLKAVGDIMFHEYQLSRSYNSETEQFNFSDSFKNVKHYLTDADFTIGNLETTFAGPNGAHNFNVENWVAGYSGYPCFNTPDIAAANIKDVGFDLLTTANNHSLDSKLTGLIRTLDILDQNDLLHVGTYRTEEEANQIQTVDINGIKFSFISFTYAMNGFSPPEEKEYIINYLDMYAPEKEKQMCDLVKKANEQNPDFIVVMPHFGNEYVEFPNSYQENLVDALFEAGASIIFGSHPHVLQPIEVREITRSDGTTSKGIVIYSLSNFISSQKYELGVHKDLGVIMGLDFKKIEDQKATIEGISLVPTYTYWTKEVIGILPVEETLEKLKNNEITLTNYDINRLEFAKNYTINHLMTYIKDYEYGLKGNQYYIKLD